VNHCIFGGSFDPPHEGHRHLARAAGSAFAIDRLYWVPAQDPPHKSAPGTPFRHRVEMCRLAIAGLPRNEVSDIEAFLPKPSFSLNTIRALKARSPHPGDAWFFLIGADNWAIFPKWHQPAEVLKESEMIVYPRKGFAIGPMPPGVRALELDLLPESSSEIRAALARGESPEAAGVLPEIRGYIAEHGLYAPVGAA
jgi:nicotinate-nucleotide adenylyltransferase